MPEPSFPLFNQSSKELSICWPIWGLNSFPFCRTKPQVFMKPFTLRKHTRRFHTSQHTIPRHITLGNSAPIITPLKWDCLVVGESLWGEVWALRFFYTHYKWLLFYQRTLDYKQQSNNQAKANTMFCEFSLNINKFHVYVNFHFEIWLMSSFISAMIRSTAVCAWHKQGSTFTCGQSAKWRMDAIIKGWWHLAQTISNWTSASTFVRSVPIPARLLLIF